MEGGALRVRHRQLREVVDRRVAYGALSEEKVVLRTGSRHHLDWSVSHGLLLLLLRESRGHRRLNLHMVLLIVGSRVKLGGFSSLDRSFRLESLI